MIPGVSGAGPISAFTGSGGFDGGTATSGADQRSGTATGSKNFYFNPPPSAAQQAASQVPVLAVVALVGLFAWYASKR